MGTGTVSRLVGNLPVLYGHHHVNLLAHRLSSMKLANSDGYRLEAPVRFSIGED